MRYGPTTCTGGTDPSRTASATAPSSRSRIESDARSSSTRPSTSSTSSGASAHSRSRNARRSASGRSTDLVEERLDASPAIAGPRLTRPRPVTAPAGARGPAMPWPPASRARPSTRRRRARRGLASGRAHRRSGTPPSERLPRLEAGQLPSAASSARSSSEHSTARSREPSSVTMSGVPAALLRGAPPRRLDEHLPHGARCDALEVQARRRLDAQGARQLQVGLVDERGGVERLARARRGARSRPASSAPRRSS